MEDCLGYYDELKIAMDEIVRITGIGKEYITTSTAESAHISDKSKPVDEEWIDL